MKMPRIIPNETVVDLKHLVEQGLCGGNSKAVWRDNHLHAVFTGAGDVHQLVIPIDRTLLANGYSAQIWIQGWEKIRYLALGYNATPENKFVHVKIPNPKQGAWFEFCVSHNDIVFKLQNDWQEVPPGSIPALRVYIKGEFKERGELLLSKASAFLEEGANAIAGFERVVFNEGLVGAIENYWESRYPEFEKQAREYLESGSFPIGSYPVMTNKVHWNPRANKPVSTSSPTTYRYSWHALNAASVLVLAYKKSPELMGLIISARDLVSDWIRESYFNVDDDQKYCWYDHGAAERTLVLIVMFELGIKHNFEYRFMARLYHVLIKHAQLMESEAFYASHQSTRYHNHAWFQDIALIASAIAFGDRLNTVPWLLRGIERLQDQFEYLIKEESGYSIFMENSIGYHNGIIRIIKFSSLLASLAGQEHKIAETAKALERWSNTFVYPDGRIPAQGDTFRMMNPCIRNNVILPTDWRTNHVCLPENGYVVVKGGEPNCPWMLSVLGTNLNRTHKHEDDLSFSLWLDGVEWLIDPSFYSYDINDGLSSHLKSAKAHNMLFVKDLPYSIDPNPGRVTLGSVQSVDANGRRSLSVSGRSVAYRGYVVTREMSCSIDDQGFDLQCIDKCASIESHEDEAEVFLSFHFGDGVRVERLGDTHFELSHAASLMKLNLALAEPLGRADMDIRESFSGLGFMQKVETTQLLVRIPQGISCSWRMYISE